MKPEQEQVRDLLAQTVTLLCKNGLSFQEEMRIEALIGITIDRDDVFLVHINEKLDPSQSVGQANALEALSAPQNVHVTLKKQGKSGANTKDTLPPSKRKGAREGRRGGAKRGRGQGRNHNRNYGKGSQVNNNTSASSVAQTEHSNSVTQDPIITDVDSVQFTTENMSVKKEPPDTERDGAMVVGDMTVKVEVPSMSDDDTSAMRRTYSSLQDSSVDNLGNNFDEQLTPPRKKKRNTSTTSSENNQDSNSPFIPAFAKTLTTEEDCQGLMPVSSWPNIAGIGDIGDSSPGCSAWTTPSSTPAKTGQGSETVGRSSNTEPKYPSVKLSSRKVREVLDEYLVAPMAAVQRKVCAFRLVWHPKDHNQSIDHIWSEIIGYRLLLDELVAEVPGVAFFLSAITATTTRPKVFSAGFPVKNFPGLAHWIICSDPLFNELLLYQKVQNTGFGARLKPLVDQPGAASKDDMGNALFLVAKDYGEGFVRNKVNASSCALTMAEEGQSWCHPLIKFYTKPEHVHVVRKAQSELLKARFMAHLVVLGPDGILPITRAGQEDCESNSDTEAEIE